MAMTKFRAMLVGVLLAGFTLVGVAPGDELSKSCLSDPAGDSIQCNG